MFLLHAIKSILKVDEKKNSILEQSAADNGHVNYECSAVASCMPRSSYNVRYLSVAVIKLLS